MKKIQLILSLFLIGIISVTAQEKKIKFDKGTLTICSKKTFLIEGYDGKEVTIEAIHDTNTKSNIVVKGMNKISSKNDKSKVVTGYSIASSSKSKNGSTAFATTVNKDGQVILRRVDKERQKGLKSLGKNNSNEELGIYFTIEKRGDELIFKDENRNGVTLVRNEKYNIKIPNSVKIKWLSSSCSSNLKKADNKFVFYSSDESSISNFKGEVAINSTLRNTKLVDVSGPVSLNSLGGNFTIIFDKTLPNELYSVYTNNGFIDITLPKNSSLNVKAIGKSIFSDLDFKILSEKELNDFGHINQEMNLKLNSGKVKMNLNAGYGNVYLRKK